MRYPWQTWLAFVFCLALALGAMAWLTVQGIELDRAEAAARTQLEESRRKAIELQRQAEQLQSEAELEELVSQALWRMDTAIAPVLAQEAARPYFVYRPYFTLPPDRIGKGVAPTPTASPLLKQPSPFVRLHFQIDAGDNCTSPQVPPHAFEQLALEQGVSRDDLNRSKELLGQLQEKLHRPDLLACLSDQVLPTVALGNDSNWEASAWALLNPNSRGRGNFDPNGDFQQALQPSAPPGAQAGGQVGQLPVSPNPPLQVAETAQQKEPPQPMRPELEPPVRIGSPTLPPVGQQAATQPPNLGPQQQQAELEPNYQVVGSPYAANGVGLNAPPQLAQQQAEQTNEGRAQYSRINTKWQDRNRALQAYAAQTLVQTRGGNSVNPADLAPPSPTPQLQVSEGITRPFWLGSELFLARRVMIGKETYIQGCWLDWPALRQQLLTDVSDLLPDVELLPVSEATSDTSRLLATLPIELKLPAHAPIAAVDALAAGPIAATVSPLGIALWVAWIGLLLAAAAVAALLLGVVSLSERRAAFVAAVTHELRTPLTTFRMYAEMLAENMVPDEARRQEYLDTLRVESDRLYHLVENVLSYARLEKGPSADRLQKVSLGDQLARMQNRLRDRAAAAKMELVIEADDAARKLELRTDPTAVEQIFFNLVDNACKYAALAEDRRIHVQIARDGNQARCTVRDHGPGISQSAACRLFQPFSKSVHEAADTATPGVGLGLALSQRLAGELGGDLILAPADAKSPGACFVLTLPLAT